MFTFAAKKLHLLYISHQEFQAFYIQNTAALKWNRDCAPKDKHQSKERYFLTFFYCFCLCQKAIFTKNINN